MNLSCGTTYAAPGGASLTAKPAAARSVFRAICCFCGYLLVLELLTDFFRWPGLVEGWLRFIPYCAFLAALVCYARPAAKLDKKTAFIALFLVCTFIALLLDVTRHLESLESVPLLGRESQSRRSLQSFVIILALACFLAGNYFAVLEISDTKAQLAREVEKLRQVERALRRQLAFDDLVTRSLTRFASGAGARLDEGIQTALQEIAEFTGADSAFVVVISLDAKTWSASHEWCGPGVPSLFHEFQHIPIERLAWSAGKLLAGEVLAINRLEDFPPEAGPDRLRAEAAGIKSVLQVPLRGQRERVIGCLGLQALAGQVTWAEEDIRRLRMVGDSLANALERKRLEEQFRESQKMEAFGQLAGGVAHDFNNILTVIQSHASWMQEQELSKAERAESIGEILQAAHRAATLTRQLLAFSRRQILQARNLDLNEVVGNMTKMLQRLIGEHIVLEAQFAPGGARVCGDPGMIEQVLMNLAINSRDAMPKGGRLAIQTAFTVLRENARAAHPKRRPGRYVRLTVRDTGCGIPAEHLPRIFEPFFTTKEAGKGTGLGLATVFGIVEQHHGWIEVESEPGEGAAFHAFLPRAEENSHVPADHPPVAEARGGIETILLVEDEAPVRALARSNLERYGYRVLEAASGPAALALWRQHQEAIELLLTDIVLPGGMSGVELAERLRLERNELKVICCTGYSDEALDQGFSVRGSGPLLRKPYTPAELAQTVREVLDAARRPGGQG